MKPPAFGTFDALTSTVTPSVNAFSRRARSDRRERRGGLGARAAQVWHAQHVPRR
jgi:hypothetical protein